MIDILKRTASEFSRDNCMQAAAALAYYTIFSLPPLLVIIVSVAGFVTDTTGFSESEKGEPGAVQQRIDEEITSVVGKEGAEQVDTMIEQAQKPGRGLWGTIIGVVVLIFGATGAMVQLQAAMNQAWNVKPDPDQGGIKNFLLKRVMSLAMILTVAFLLLVSLVVTTILEGLQQQIAGALPEGLNAASLQAINVGVSFLIITLLFAAMYRYLPDARVAWKDVFVGAAFTGFLFVLAKWGLGLYLGYSDMGSTYGAAGALALILVWIYYSAVILLLGAEFTEVWARSRGRGLEPEDGAVIADANRNRTQAT